MVYSVFSCALIGLEAHSVTCEVDLANQLPTLTLVGLPSSITQESRERIRAAVANSGFEWPARKVTINLLPASLPKWGSHFELAMALGVLGAVQLVNPEVVNQDASPCVLAVGELSLTGEVRPCGWLSAIADWIVQKAIAHRNARGEPLLVIAQELEVRELIRAAPVLSELCELTGVRNLGEAFSAMREASLRVAAVGLSTDNAGSVSNPESTPKNGSNFELLAQVKDEPLGVVAALAAIAGRHHCIFAGPQGMGKSMLIRAICEALPPLTTDEVQLRSSILRTFGESSAFEFSLKQQRPVVGLQASISRAALEGALHASGQVMPGELTRAHFGVVVADELLEFRRDVIEAFRQPLEEGFVRLQRAKFRTILPTKFQFLASTNLCPCGYHGHGRRLCRCRVHVRGAYQSRLSGPVLDRFDLIVLVGQRGERSADIPVDLMPMVDALLDSKHWEARVAQARSDEPSSQTSPAEVWSQVPHAELSDRGRLKLARVSRTLAGLLGEARSVKHFRLALLVRQDIDALLRPAVEFHPKKPSRLMSLHNI